MKHKIGGKASGLKWLKENRDLGFVVPEFRVIDTSYYDEYIRIQELARLASVLESRRSSLQSTGSFNIPQRLEERCRRLAGTFKGKGVSVRSSAVVSEDNEKLSGAGMYDTFFLDEEVVTPENLLDRVLRVYASVNSDRAIVYRQENGIKEEKMAVIIQELVGGTNYLHGVVKSRLPARAGVIPISWSGVRGAVVGNLNARIATAYFNEKKRMAYGNKCIFMTENAKYDEMYDLDEVLISLIPSLRKRYGKEFEAEFAFDMAGKNAYLLQIRALTNVQDVHVEFPKNKRALFVAGLCVGAGEYLGPMVFKEDVCQGWDELGHYAYVAPMLGKTKKSDLDYDLHTPNKRAIILTHQFNPDAHALNIANEKGLLCICFDGPSSRRDRCDDMLEKSRPYVHVVCDGLVGKVYKATQEEAEAFSHRMFAQKTR